MNEFEIPSGSQRPPVNWLRDRLREEIGDGGVTFTGFLSRTAARCPAKTAMVCGDRVLTYEALFREVSAVADQLVSRLGLKAGEPTALLLQNSERYQIIYLAIIATGGIAVPLNCGLTAREIAFQLQNSGARRVVSEAKFAAVLEEVGASWTSADALTGAGGPFVDLAHCPVSADSPAAIYYTSGTTGSPKGVVHTHRTLIAGALQGPAAWEYNVADAVTLAMTPLFHIANHTWFLPVLAVGGTMVIDTFKTDHILRLISERRITHLFAVPTMLLLMSQKHAGSGLDFSHVRNVAFGAAPMPPEKLADVKRMFPNAGLVHGMGQTESCGTIVTLPSGHAFDKAGSVGIHIVGADVRVVNEVGADTAAGEVGELITRGPNVMVAYHERPGATAETLAGGWLHTGDLGYLDADGYLFLVDRKKDMIIRGGENVYSSEVENVLYMHRGVIQAAVVAAKSEIFGEEVYAFVVRKKEASEVSEAQLREHCAANLAPFKIPVGIAFLDELPQTATGKIQKHVLRKLLPQQFR